MSCVSVNKLERNEKKSKMNLYLILEKLINWPKKVGTLWCVDRWESYTSTQTKPPHLSSLLPLFLTISVLFPLNASKMRGGGSKRSIGHVYNSHAHVHVRVCMSM